MNSMSSYKTYTTFFLEKTRLPDVAIAWRVFVITKEIPKIPLHQLPSATVQRHLTLAFGVLVVVIVLCHVYRTMAQTMTES